MCGPNDRLFSSTPKIVAILDENTEAAERLETWGGGGAHRTPSQAHTPTQISQNVLSIARWQVSVIDL